MYLPAQWGVCAPSSCNADGVKQIADFNIGLLFSELNIDVSTKVVEKVLAITRTMVLKI